MLRRVLEPAEAIGSETGGPMGLGCRVAKRRAVAGRAATMTPTIPTNLVASSPLVGRVDLTWTDTSANETRFEIAQDDTLAVQQSPAANVTAATFTGLNAATSYHWYVRACNAAGCSAWLAASDRSLTGGAFENRRVHEGDARLSGSGAAEPR
jgi:hypothetical protein